MCYSKEVQLATGSIMIIFCLYYYFLYSPFYEKWMIPFLRNSILTLGFVGVHLIMEFITLQYSSQTAYKIGLISSIMGMYFLIRALESILNRNLRSRLALLSIGLLAIYTAILPASYSTTKFFLSHDDAFVWSFMWSTLFVYLHIAVFSTFKDLKTKSAIMFGIIDISFLLSVIYAVWGYFNYGTNMCNDTPSIWCAFSSIQVLALPNLLIAIPLLVKTKPKKTSQTYKQTALYYLISIGIISLIYNYLPKLSCVAEKFSFQ